MNDLTRDELIAYIAAYYTEKQNYKELDWQAYFAPQSTRRIRNTYNKLKAALERNNNV
jgi:hypothetical protein